MFRWLYCGFRPQMVKEGDMKITFEHGRKEELVEGLNQIEIYDKHENFFWTDNLPKRIIEFWAMKLFVKAVFGKLI